MIGVAFVYTHLAYFFSAGWRFAAMGRSVLITAFFWPLMLISWFRDKLNPEETVPIGRWRRAMEERNDSYDARAKADAKLEVLEDYMRFRGFGDDLASIEAKLRKNEPYNVMYSTRGRLTGWTKGSKLSPTYPPAIQSNAAIKIFLRRFL